MWKPMSISMLTNTTSQKRSLSKCTQGSLLSFTCFVLIFENICGRSYSFSSSSYHHVLVCSLLFLWGPKFYPSGEGWVCPKPKDCFMKGWRLSVLYEPYRYLQTTVWPAHWRLFGSRPSGELLLVNIIIHQFPATTKNTWNVSRG